MQASKLILRPGREASVLRRHPWIFEGAVARLEGKPESGETVAVCGADGEELAQAAYSPVSQIRARVWTFDSGEKIGGEFFRRRIERAYSLRARLRKHTRAWRWINAENDGLPGLIVDVYDKYAIAQFLSAGSDKWKGVIGEILYGTEGIAGVFEKSDSDSRTKEGLAVSEGSLVGEAPPERIVIEEAEIRLAVDVRRGHKTGFYLDQRENREVIRGLSEGVDGLNAFCYTGGFTAAMLRGGATTVVSVDSSGPALDLARENVALNVLKTERAIWVEEDVFRYLRQCRDSRREFGLIVLDPPKFAANKASLDRAARAYKDINMLGMKLLRPGGKLVTFSCSGLLGVDMFQKIIFGAALDARRKMQIVRRLGQPEDHPVLVDFPEGEYLKGLVLRCCE